MSVLGIFKDFCYVPRRPVFVSAIIGFAYLLKNTQVIFSSSFVIYIYIVFNMLITLGRRQSHLLIDILAVQRYE